MTAYYTGSAQTFKVTVEGHGGAIDINGTPSSTMDYNLKNVEKKTVNVIVAQTANYLETPATAYIEILPAVIKSVTLGTTKFAFGTLNTENAKGTLNTENANATTAYGKAVVAFVEGKGSGSPEFTYLLSDPSSLSDPSTVKGNDKKDYIVVGKYLTCVT